MSFFVLLLFLCFTFVSSKPGYDPHPLSDQFIDRINSYGSTWRAKRNIHSETSWKMIQKLSASRIKYPTVTDDEYSDEDGDFQEGDVDDLDVLVLDENSNITIPSEFDARQKWPYCNSIGQISDQSVCGSCWAFATTEMITDRICIHSLGSSTPEISAQDLLTCGFWNGDGCDGSSVVTALEYWVDNGISTGGGFGSKNGCKSYTFISCTNEDGNKNSTRPKCSDVDELNAPTCDKRCDDIRIDYETSLYFGNKIYRIESVVRTIQLEILNNGPVIATFMAYEDFLHYHHGIYRYLMGEELGYHSVKIIGWGEEDGTPYWVVANSYNDEWGEDGFFRILRGTNECFIENFLYAGIPELNPVMNKVR
ncbi:hypothetical protein WA026_005888 [Henosepilachna vigintioctopunctata]|uniref:Peptidase C1A papain C-terminal domain-containing protein n=1 Tax=Henosepilachna vigintioctopunctata TaxID=420089 RepID=A0AAW1TXU3_9CUCU